MYVAHTVTILREIRRVLRPDGVIFLNLGDSYASGKGTCFNPGGGQSSLERHAHLKNRQAYPLDRGNKSSLTRMGLKPKDLCLIPHRVMLAAQADGWWVRSDIIWAKPNPMPESCRDRPTDAYEHIIMLTKSAKYYFDQDAVREPHLAVSLKRIESGLHHKHPSDIGVGIPPVNTERMGERFCHHAGRNIRNVWTFATQPYGGHFATFPEELPRRCIKAASKAGDVVLDPFGGSGTTGRVAIELGRTPVLLDIAYGGGAYDALADKRTRNVQRALL